MSGKMVCAPGLLAEVSLFYRRFVSRKVNCGSALNGLRKKILGNRLHPFIFEIETSRDVLGERKSMTPEAWSLIKHALIEGDEAAFAQLYKLLWSKLYSTAYNYVRDQATAREIVQEVFVNLWVKRNDLEQVRDITGFAMTSMKFKIYDHFDKKAVEKKYTMKAVRDAITSVEDTLQQVEYEETAQLIRKEIDNLPATTGKIFRLSRFQQLTNEEIAKTMKLSVKAVEYHITQSLKQLRLRIGNLLSLIIIVSCF
jgi:RNA polymerase sigma-70 factor (ECF subfamily)